MKKTVIFGGTSEGRRLAKLCCGQGVPVVVCVATQYGEELLQELPEGIVHRGRMDKEEIKAFLEREAPGTVVDATHPYAELVSENLKSACRDTGLEYCRLKRESLEKNALEKRGILFADSVEEAAGKAERLPGNIFVATGSKELPVFCEKISDRSRLYVRILPSEEALQKCFALGLSGRQLFCMQGPFSEEMNRAMFRAAEAEILVTKESGSAGGFAEKLKAAEELSMTVIVVRRPLEEEGDSFEKVCERLGIVPEEDEADRYRVVLQGNGQQEKEKRKTGYGQKACAEAGEQEGGLPEVIVAGIGMGDKASMTYELAEALEGAEVIFGASRVLESVGYPEKPKICEYKSDGVKKYLLEHPSVRRAAVVFSGDVGFYSGAEKLCRDFAGYPLRLVSGISTVSYLAARLRMPWQDIRLCSAHGRNCNLAAQIRREGKVFALFGKSGEVRELAGRLAGFGMKQVKCFIGIRLSYPDERIFSGYPEDFLAFREKGLCAGIFENPCPDETVTPGIADGAFVRGNVPMTKEEIRELALCRLLLKKDSIVYDIGAGTGSVAIECARLVPEGTVYAIEKGEEALKLLSENRRKFGAEQMEVIAGEAPEAFRELPAPDCVFIGGSGGKLREILEGLRRKNGRIRIVMTSVSLETQAEMAALMREFPIMEPEAAAVSISRLKALGGYHLWQGMNPVTVYSFWI